ncbi:hypothetical protein [Streptomyces sp. 4F14]
MTVTPGRGAGKAAADGSLDRIEDTGPARPGDDRQRQAQKGL